MKNIDQGREQFHIEKFQSNIEISKQFEILNFAVIDFVSKVRHFAQP